MGLSGYNPPKGVPNAAQKARVIQNSKCRWFRFKTRLWQTLTWRSRIHWVDFEAKLDISTYCDFEPWRKDWRSRLSVGWAGSDPSEPTMWRFGFNPLLLRIRVLRSVIIQHELLHTLQDFLSKQSLFLKERNGELRWYETLWLETEAHVFGGPLIGIPVVLAFYGGGLTVIIQLLVLVMAMF